MQDRSQSEATRVAEGLRERIQEIYVEAVQCVSPERVDKHMRQWLDAASTDMEVARAMAYAVDLAIFTPSGSGSTAIERLAKHRGKSDADDEAAFNALRGARVRLVHLCAHETSPTLTVEDIVSSETIAILHDGMPATASDITMICRLAPLGNGLHGFVGPVVPLDAAAQLVASGFVRPNAKDIANPLRCLEAVYRQIVRHGTVEIAGLNSFPDEIPEDDDLPFGPEDSEVDAIAFRWEAMEDGAEPPADDALTIRTATTLATILDALAASVMAGERGRDRLADVYARIAAMQLETVRLRESAGVSGPSIPVISAAIAHLIAEHGAPIAIRRLFESLTGRTQPTAADSDVERLVQRIRALRAKTVEQGCTEHEALAAAEKVAELLDRHGLSLSEMEFRHQACTGIGIDTGRKRLGPIDDCVPSIGAFFDCRTWSERRNGASIRHVFFGLRADVEAAHYLYDLIQRAFDTESAVFARGPIYGAMAGGDRRRAATSFQIGLTRGIIAKLGELRAAREASLRSSGRDLVPMKSSAVEEEFAKLGLRFRARGGGSSRTILTDAYEAGREAGQRFEYLPGLEAAD